MKMTKLTENEQYVYNKIVEIGKKKGTVLVSEVSEASKLVKGKSLSGEMGSLRKKHMISTNGFHVFHSD